ncbi:hypothetical protein OUZ56_019463 [Daphnia magna]|uniref:Uncharacterized protein n=1 Tax=Daphnia magna TaxID=35525 RepID=A0ABQ9ZBN7_9CRUS|nr:hypothetical protein OUZ56_019463 [Daphnia magna]
MFGFFLFLFFIHGNNSFDLMTILKSCFLFYFFNLSPHYHPSKKRLKLLINYAFVCSIFLASFVLSSFATSEIILCVKATAFPSPMFRNGNRHGGKGRGSFASVLARNINDHHRHSTDM